MKVQRGSHPFRKKYAFDQCQENPNGKLNPFETPSKYNTIDSNHTDAEISNANFSIQSSRIADEASQVPARPALPSHFEQLLREKLEYFEAETGKLLQKKDRDIYFLQVELQNYEVRLAEADEAVQDQKQEITQLRARVQQLITESSDFAQNNHFLQETLQKMGAENARLKESLDLQIAEKNESLKVANRREYMSVQGGLGQHHLKREVEDLRQMVAQMERTLRNCPSCFTLRRENEELAQAYNHLKGMYSHLGQQKNAHEKDLLQNITAKIQENQNIVRENLQLREKRGGSGLRAGRQKLKESVAKRCRTLTDQY